jgi:hypothetical protein
MRRTAFAPLLVAALLATVACGERVADPGGGEGRTGASGIRGTVLLGPQCPVVVEGSPCPDTPFDADIQVLDRTGEVVTTVHSGEDGTFEVALDPGTYTLQGVPSEGSPFPFAKPVTVTVEPETFTEITVNFDTGIR